MSLLGASEQAGVLGARSRVPRPQLWLQDWHTHLTARSPVVSKGF